MSQTNRPFLTTRWLDLVMLNFEVDPQLLLPRVPVGTQLDQYDGRTLASLVGFRYEDTRLLGLPIPFHRDFVEVNLRFYVVRDCDGEIRRGVVFVKEIVPSPFTAAVARWIYNENFVRMPMRHQIQSEPDGQRLTYAWRNAGRWNSLAARTHTPPTIPAAGSEAEFVTEHYWGYAKRRDGGTNEYRVDHPQWSVTQTTDCSFDCDIESIYGSQFKEVLSRPPSTAFVASGSEVVVRRGTRLAT